MPGELWLPGDFRYPIEQLCRLQVIRGTAGLEDVPLPRLVKRRWGHDVPTVGSNIDARIDAYSVLDGLAAMTEEEVTTASPGVRLHSLWERPMFVLKVLKREKAVLPVSHVHIEHHDARDCPRSHSDVGVRICGPPCPDLRDVTGRVLDAVGGPRVLARRFAACISAGASSVRYRVEGKHRPTTHGIAEGGFRQFGDLSPQTDSTIP